jgi:hypothetical protein
MMQNRRTAEPQNLRGVGFYRQRSTLVQVVSLFASLTACAEGSADFSDRPENFTDSGLDVLHADVGSSDVHSSTGGQTTTQGDVWWASDGMDHGESGSGVDVNESGEIVTRTTDSSLRWLPATTWQEFQMWWNSPNDSLARTAYYGRAAGSAAGCSGSLISRDLFATAHHCGAASTISVRFMNNSPERANYLFQRFENLGFGNAERTSQIASARMPWTCNYWYQEASRDLVYYSCGPRTFTVRPGMQAEFWPGEIFGHLDIQVSVPGVDANVHALTQGAGWWMDSAFQQTMLSPNGTRVSASSVTFTEGGVTYTPVYRTVGDDMNDGGSGGASILASNSRAWAVWTGWNNSTSASCYDSVDDLYSPDCTINRHYWTPLHEDVLPLQYIPRASSLEPPSSLIDASLAGGTGGTAVSAYCASDEAMIGVLHSLYNDVYTSGASTYRILGNFGAICAPVSLTAQNRLQLDHANVFTRTSHDTGFLTSIDPETGRTRLNRYMNTVLSDGITGAPNSQQELFVCPAEYAIAELSLRVKYGRVRGINSATCRHVSGSASGPDPKFIPGSDVRRAAIRNQRPPYSSILA